MSRSFGYLDSPAPIAFAHRGGATADRENVAGLFEQVQRLGYRYVEIDVRTTADGVPLVFHDADLRRLTGHAARVRSLPFARIEKLSLRGGEQIARLEDVLAGFPGLRFNIDLKDDAAVRCVPDVLRRTGTRDRVCITSFIDRRIRRARTDLGPDVCTGLGVVGVLRLGLGRTRTDAAVLQVPWRLPGGVGVGPRLLELGRRAGLPVHVWTLNDLPSIRAALDLGVDGVMTDEPELLKGELLRRGQWPG